MKQKKTMIKKLAAALPALAMIFSLTACSLLSDSKEEAEKAVTEIDKILDAYSNEEKQTDEDGEGTTTTTAPAPTTSEKETTSQQTTTASEEDTLDPEFKAAMDSYEEFVDEYVAFMEKYMANPSDLSLLTDYATFASDLVKFEADFAKWESEDLNAAEAAYYLEVSSRVSAKLLKAIQ